VGEVRFDKRETNTNVECILVRETTTQIERQRPPKEKDGKEVREGLGLGISKNVQSRPVWRETGRKQAKRIKYEGNKGSENETVTRRKRKNRGGWKQRMQMSGKRGAGRRHKRARRKRDETDSGNPAETARNCSNTERKGLEKEDHSVTKTKE